MSVVTASGTGGKIIVTSASAAELAVGSYTLTKKNKHGDITSSNTGGWETATIIVRGGSINAKIFWDTTASMNPEALGLDVGFTANLWIGSTGKMYGGVVLLTESLALVGCSQEGVVEFDVEAKINSALGNPVTAT